jgi:hypothetical protein
MVELPDAIVSFDASTSIDDGEVIGYYFDFGDKRTSGWIDTPTITHNYRAAGTFAASLIVKDNDDVVSESQAWVEINVIEPPVNEPPRILSVQAEPEEVYAGRSIDLVVEAEDPDNDISEYIYSPSAGTIIGSGRHVQWLAPGQPGDYSIEITVIDSAKNFDRVKQHIPVEPLPLQFKSNLRLNADLEPFTLTTDGSQEGVITASVEWLDAPSTMGNPGSDRLLSEDEVEGIRADLTVIGEFLTAELRDDGRRGDELAGDGIYTLEFPVSKSSLEGDFEIPITASIADGRTLSGNVNLQLVAPEDEKVEEPLGLPGFDGIIATISILVVVFLIKSRGNKH